jgi:hypothetical protein
MLAHHGARKFLGVLTHEIAKAEENRCATRESRAAPRRKRRDRSGNRAIDVGRRRMANRGLRFASGGIVDRA